MISPGAPVGLALGEAKVRMVLGGILRSLGLTCMEWNSLGDVVMGMDALETPLDVLFFGWESAQDSGGASQIQAIRLHEKGTATQIFALSSGWNDIRTRMRARVAGCDDMLALPPDPNQIRRALGFPVEEHAAPEPPAASPALPEATNSEDTLFPPDFRVLVVDDAAVVRVGLSRLLSKMGCVVVEAENGQDALRKLSSADPRVIITDLLMPYMDGFGFMEKLREKEPWNRVPVIVVSGYGDKPRLIQALRHGAVDFIVKPFRPEVIRQKLMNILHQEPH